MTSHDTGSAVGGVVEIRYHTEAYRAYCMLSRDFEAYLAGDDSIARIIDEDAWMDAMAGLRDMMLPAERRSLDEDGPLVLPDVEGA